MLCTIQNTTKIQHSWKYNRKGDTAQKEIQQRYGTGKSGGKLFFRRRHEYFSHQGHPLLESSSSLSHWIFYHIISKLISKQIVNPAVVMTIVISPVEQLSVLYQGRQQTVRNISCQPNPLDLPSPVKYLEKKNIRCKTQNATNTQTPWMKLKCALREVDCRSNLSKV